MPTHKSIPERYPVIEHMERRLARRQSSGHRVAPVRRTTSWVGALILGGLGGAMLVVAFVAVVQGGA